MKEELLKNIIDRLEESKKEVKEKIKSYEEEIEKYKESNKELENSFTIEVITDKTEKWTKSLKACKEVKDIANRLNDYIRGQKELVINILNYNLNLGDLDKFFEMVLNIDGYDSQGYFGDCAKMAKATMIKLPFKSSDFSKFNQVRGIILMKADYMVKEKRYFINNNSNKSEVAKEIIQMIKSSNIIQFYDLLLGFYSANLKRIDDIAKENGEKIQEIREDEIKKRKEEVNNNIKELNKKIDECKETLSSIDEVYKLYDEYKETESKDILLAITQRLADLVVISQRESKKITYEKEERKELEEEPILKEEITPKEIIIEEPKEFDNEYFMNKDTKRIICFLGTDNDSAITDINGLDKSLRTTVCNKLNDLFNTLIYTNDNPFDGHGPGPNVSDNVKALLKKPINAIYRTVGSKKIPYRIHSIEKSSELIRKLGFGQGKLIFIGSIGQNNNESKTDTYNDLGRRAIKDANKNHLVLRTNFNYIEHITRGFIPASLLAESDKDVINKYKSNKSKVIEDSMFVYYDVLNNETMNNVRSYLIEYFSNQTSIMKDIIDKNKKLSGESLG